MHRTFCLDDLRYGGHHLDAAAGIDGLAPVAASMTHRAPTSGRSPPDGSTGPTAAPVLGSGGTSAGGRRFGGGEPSVGGGTRTAAGNSAPGRGRACYPWGGGLSAIPSAASSGSAAGVIPARYQAGGDQAGASGKAGTPRARASSAVAAASAGRVSDVRSFVQRRHGFVEISARSREGSLGGGRPGVAG